LSSPAGVPKKLAEVQNHDAALGGLAVLPNGHRDGAPIVDRDFETGLIELFSTAALLFLAASDLLDDERREHGFSFPGKPTHEDVR
jgi:hypothetical protein